MLNTAVKNKYSLQYLKLVSRLEHPENYTEKENVNRSILHLIGWLKNQSANYPHCKEDFIDVLIEYEKYIGYEIIDTTILMGCYLMFANLRSVSFSLDDIAVIPVSVLSNVSSSINYSVPIYKTS